jgi:hypothetical protein
MNPLGNILFLLIQAVHHRNYLRDCGIMYFLGKLLLAITLSIVVATVAGWIVSYLSTNLLISQMEQHNRFDIYNDVEENDDDEDSDYSESDSDYSNEDNDYSDEDSDYSESDSDYSESDSDYSESDSDYSESESDYSESESDYSESDDEDYEMDSEEINDIDTSNFLIENIDKNYNIHVNKYDEDKNDNVFIDRLYTNEIVALVDRTSGTTETPLFKIVEQIGDDPLKYRIKLHQFKDKNNKVYYGFLANAEPAWWTRDGLCLDLDASALIDENTGNTLHNFSLIHTVV